MTSKRRNKKRRGFSLLIEPSIEEHLEACKRDFKAAHTSSAKRPAEEPRKSGDMFECKKKGSVINRAAEGCDGDKSRPAKGQKAKLTSLLMLLFGSSLLLLMGQSANFALARSQQQRLSLSIARSNLTNGTADPQAPVQPTASEPPLAAANGSRVSSSLVNGHGSATESPIVSEETTTTTTTNNNNLEPDAVEERESAGAETPASDSGGDQSAEPNKLGELIVGTASEVADQFVGRLRGSRADEESSDTSNNKEEDEEEEGGQPQVSGGTNKRQAERANGTSGARFETVEERQLKEAMDTYLKWRSAGDDVIELFSRKMLPVIVEHGYDVDALTVTGLLQVFNGIRALKPWALKLLDASAKLTPGLLVGTQSDFGDFDECLNIRVDDPSGLESGGEPLVASEIDESTGLKASTLVGRYCLADVEFPKPPRIRLAARDEELKTDFAPIELRKPLLNFSETAAFKETIFVETANFFHMLYVDPIRVGVCLTNKIDPENFAKVLNKIIEHFRVSINFRGRCVTKYDKPTWTSYQKVSAYVLATACSLVILCTLLDLLHAKLDKLPFPESCLALRAKFSHSSERYRPLFTSFSIIRNTKRLFKPQVASTKQHGQSLQERSAKGCIGGQQFNLNLGQAVNNCSALGLSLQASSSSLDSSPTTDRRSSVTSSALNLISDGQTMVAGSKGHLLGNQFSASIGPSGSPKRAKAKLGRNSNNLLCLHGIRVLTMTWMIVNHTYLFGGFFVLWAHRRLIDIAEWPKSLSFQLVLNGWLTVETYFFLSATIIVLNVMPLMQNHKFAYFAYILHRLVRLLPAYLGLVCLNFLWPLVSSGPVWLVKGKNFIQTPCENYLWTNFLFINNWIWPEKQCMVHTWFLSADFQLYLLAPIIVYLLYRRPVFGHSVNIIVAILASILSGFVIYANKLMPTTLINKLEFDSIKQQLSYSYFATYQHLGPYCLGIFTGYLLHKRPQVQLPKHLTWLLWLLLPPLSFTTLLLTYLWNGAYPDPALINPSPLVSALYVAIHRTIWTSLIAWIVFACATGRAKLMSSFLSHSMFVPLSRLSFSIYLAHLPVIMFRALNLRHTIEWTDTNILWEACGNFVASTIVGYFINVTFESPLINLEQIVFGRRTGAGPKSEEQSDSGNQNATNSKLDNQKTDSVNDLDESKSLTRSSEQSDSSPSQDRKEAPKSSLNSAGTLQENEQLEHISSQQMRWNRPTSKRLLRKAFRPKQIPSVEKIFGQVNPFELHSSDETNSLGELSTIQTSTELEPFDPRQQELEGELLRETKPAGRFYIHDQSTLGQQDTSSDFNHLLSLDKEYQNWARARYHRFQHQQLAGRRPTSSYATLARTSSFDHDSAPTNGLVGRHTLARGGQAKFKSYLGEPVARTSKEVAQLSGGRANFDQRRQGRYNTLTGTGAREWRQQGFSLERAGWQRAAQVHKESLANWPQTGNLIPRIDSSTLRRQTKPSGSIVEEPTFEDHEG